ncbi:uncharacterized protein LOC143236796 [Tachypleus tridentatus]|uniref:uncharacterized protein LOC143236796 n=1 Tax=Tachypleus tridentatus TaxID=6853 RepID=UPI003FD39F07
MGDIIIEEPLNPISPSFLLYGPREVCGGEVNITVISIIGDGAAELKYFWSIFPTDKTSLVDHHKLIKEIEKRKKTLSPRIYPIDSSKLSPDIDYIVLASAQNRFKFTSNKTIAHRIKRAGSSSLVATILGHHIVSAQKDNTFEANIEVCSGGNVTKLEYSWSINSTEYSLARLKGKYVTLPKGTLRGNISYNITVTVSLNGSSEFLQAMANHIFSVTMEPLQAIINTCNISVGDHQNFSLDGSQSFDPSNTAAEMQYKWICFLQNSSTECPLSPNMVTNSSILYVEGGSLKPAIYIFTLHITKDDRESNATAVVNIVSGHVPYVVIETGSNIRVNPTQDIIITGRITSDVDVVIQWISLEGKGLATTNLSIVSPFAIPKTYTAPLVDRILPLVIPGSARTSHEASSWQGLQGNALYRFQLKAFQTDMTSVGYSDVFIRTNAPPAIPWLQIDPPEGNKSTTRFILNATEGWRDDPSDYPLKYVFYIGKDYKLRTITAAPPVVKDVIIPSKCPSHCVMLKVCDCFDSCSFIQKKTNISWKSYLNEYEEIENLVTENLNFGNYDFALATALAGKENTSRSTLLIQSVIDNFSKHLISILNAEPGNTVYINEALNLLEIIAKEGINSSTAIRNIVKLKNLVLDNYVSTQDRAATTSRSYLSQDDNIMGTNAVMIGKMTKNTVDIMSDIDKLTVGYISDPLNVSWFLANQTLYQAVKCRYRGFDQFHHNVSEDGVTFLTAMETENLDYTAIFHSPNMDAFVHWLCDNDGLCYGPCIAYWHLEKELGLMLLNVPGELKQFQLINPETGQNIHVQGFESIFLFSLQTQNEWIPDGKLVTCGRLDTTSMNWTTDGCNTTQHKIPHYTVLMCSCKLMGIFGAVLQDIPSTSVDPTEPYITLNDTSSSETMKMYQNEEDRKTVQVKIRLNIDYDKAVSGRRAEFAEHISQQIANLLRLKMEQIKNLTVSRGSVIVDFNLTHLNDSGDKVEELQSMNKNGTLALTDLEGKKMPIDSLSADISGSEDHGEETSVSEITTEASSQTQILSSSNQTSNDQLLTKTLATASTTIRNKANSEYENAKKLPVLFKVKDEYDIVVKGRKKQFISHVIPQLSSKMRVPIRCFQDFDVKPGSVLFDFNLVPVHKGSIIIDESSLEDAKHELESKIQKGEVTLLDLDGRVLLIVALTSAAASDKIDFAPIIMGIVIGIFILMIVLVTLTAITVKSINKYNCKVVPVKDKSPPPSYRSTKHQGSMGGKDKIFYRNEGSRRESVPSAAVYRPPSDSQLNKTQPPPTTVQSKLKNEWDIGSDISIIT